MPLRPLALALTLSLSALPALRAVDPAAAGFDPERLQRLDQVIQRDLDAGRLAGAVMIVKRDGQDVVLKGYGYSDLEAKTAMRPDTIFRIASMSKAVTTVAALMLYEEGRFLLSDPVAKFIPEFAHPVVIAPPPPGAPAKVKYTTVPAKRAITIRDLMTHTAGLSYGDTLAVAEHDQARLHGWYLVDHDETIGEAVKRLAKLPLAQQPGEAWVYGYGTDVLGHLIEVVSGQPLDRFLEERIFRPLRMVDTSFYVPAEKAARLAPVYGLVDGKLVRMEDSSNSKYVHGPRKLFSGGAGLCSTASDYGRFLQMLLNNGELDGVRLLSPRTVELMHRNHTGNLYRNDTTAFGLGFWVNEDPGRYGELVGPDAYGWSSAYYPQYFVDPKERLIGIFFAQLNPAPNSNLNQRFKVTIYQALK